MGDSEFRLPRAGAVDDPVRLAGDARFTEVAADVATRDAIPILLRQLAGTIRNTDERIEALSLMDAEQRVCLELLRYLEPDPGSMDRFRVYPAPTHVEMAYTIGVTRQTVARIFSRLAKDHVVEREGKVLYIRDHGKLKKTAFQVKTTQV